MNLLIVFSSHINLCNFLILLVSHFWGFTEITIPEIEVYGCFHCFAARLSGNDLETKEALDDSSSKDKAIISSYLRQIQNWFISHTQYLNFSTILVLASVRLLMTFLFLTATLFEILPAYIRPWFSYVIFLVSGAKSSLWPCWDHVRTIWDSLLEILSCNHDRESNHQNPYSGPCIPRVITLEKVYFCISASLWERNDTRQTLKESIKYHAKASWVLLSPSWWPISTSYGCNLYFL